MCYFPKSPFGKLCCCLTVLLILTAIIIGIIAAVMAATFKTPNITFDSAQATDKPPKYSLSPPSLDMEWNVTVTVQNDNSYNIDIVSGQVTAELTNAPGTVQGFSQLTPFSFPGKGTKTSFSPIVDFTWNQNNDPNMSALKIIAGACQAAGPKIPITYKFKANVKLNGVGPFPIPEITQEVQQSCPVNLNSNIAGISNLINGVSG